MLLEGMHLPLTTPFFPEGRLHLRKLEQNVARYSLTPAAGMLVLGPIGEAHLLTDAEAGEVLRTAIEAAAFAKVMLADISRDGVSATLERAEQAAVLGYDVLVVAPPAFPGSTERERRVYLQCVADRAPGPILLAGDVPADLLVELSGHPRVLGCLREFATAAEIRLLIKRTVMVKRTVTVTPVFAAVTGRMSAARRPEPSGTMIALDSLTSGGTALAVAPAKPALKTRTKEVGFQVLVAGTERMLPGLLAGAVGAVPPFAAAAPQACYEVIAAWKDGDPALAEEKQTRVVEAVRRVEGELGVAGIKYGCDLNGYFGGAPRLPLLSLPGEDKVAVEELMKALRG